MSHPCQDILFSTILWPAKSKSRQENQLDLHVPFLDKFLLQPFDMDRPEDLPEVKWDKIVVDLMDQARIDVVLGGF